jgi:hypothetical protein
VEEGYVEKYPSYYLVFPVYTTSLAHSRPSLVGLTHGTRREAEATKTPRNQGIILLAWPHGGINANPESALPFLVHSTFRVGSL